MKKNTKANLPINKLFEEEKLFEEKFVQSSVPPVAKSVTNRKKHCASTIAEDWVLKERYKREFLLIFAYTVSY